MCACLRACLRVSVHVLALDVLLTTFSLFPLLSQRTLVAKKTDSANNATSSFKMPALCCYILKMNYKYFYETFTYKYGIVSIYFDGISEVVNIFGMLEPLKHGDVHC